MSYDDKATRYAEQYGIVRFAVIENIMLYKEFFPLEGTEYSVRVNLDTGEEISREAHPRKAVFAGI